MNEKLKSENMPKIAVFYVYVILAKYPLALSGYSARASRAPASRGWSQGRALGARQLSENDILPQLTAHSWLADSAHCCLSLGI